MASSIASLSLDQLSIDTLRLLAVDGVEKANSGHPGAPLGDAPISYLLFHKLMKHNPAHSKWADRDRSCCRTGMRRCCSTGHCFFAGYKVTLDDLKSFQAVGIEDAGASGIRIDRWRGGDDRAPGTRIRNGCGDGHGREALGGYI